MAIWYLNMIEENKKVQLGMKVFQYINQNNFGVMENVKSKADVGRSGDSWGCSIL